MKAKASAPKGGKVDVYYRGPYGPWEPLRFQVDQVDSQELLRLAGISGRQITCCVVPTGTPPPLE